MSLTAEIATLREIYADWERGDYSRTDYLHPDFELVFAPDFLDEGVFRGLGESRRGWAAWLGQWSSWRATAESYIPLGERVLVLIHVYGIAKSSGLELDQRSANLWEFRDGLPARIVLYTHEDTALREFGLESA
jgi:ketosteroid isomerase-like protein